MYFFFYYKFYYLESPSFIRNSLYPFLINSMTITAPISKIVSTEPCSQSIIASRKIPISPCTGRDLFREGKLRRSDMTQPVLRNNKSMMQFHIRNCSSVHRPRLPVAPPPRRLTYTMEVSRTNNNCAGTRKHVAPFSYRTCVRLFRSSCENERWSGRNLRLWRISTKLLFFFGKLTWNKEKSETLRSCLIITD